VKQPSHNKTVIYTAIFGKKDDLHAPKVLPPGCDFICFTDQDFRSSIWKVVKVAPPLDDPTRSARKYKVLAHAFLPEYEYSVWVDGNVLVRGDVNELIERYLKGVNMAVGDHSKSQDMPIDSLKGGLERLLMMERIGKHQDDADLMQRQFDAYASAGYPDTNGLLWSLVLLRRHNEPDVIRAMEDWWREIERWSKRDQMSFNYVAWKNHFAFVYLPDDPSNSKYFRRMSHHLPWHRKLYSYWLGALKRLGRLFRA
jgi:hypothetical protein